MDQLMFVSAPDLSRLKALAQSKEYRDAYLDTHVRSSIAYQLRAIREEMGLNQKEFAHKIGMTQSVVSRLENPDYGKVTILTLLQVAAALDIALQVRFCSYADFIGMASNVSHDALCVESIKQTVTRVKARSELPSQHHHYLGSIPFLVGKPTPTWGQNGSVWQPALTAVVAG